MLIHEVKQIDVEHLQHQTCVTTVVEVTQTSWCCSWQDQEHPRRPSWPTGEKRGEITACTGMNKLSSDRPAYIKARNYVISLIIKNNSVLYLISEELFNPPPPFLQFDSDHVWCVLIETLGHLPKFAFSEDVQDLGARKVTFKCLTHFQIKGARIIECVRWETHMEGKTIQCHLVNNNTCTCNNYTFF